MDPQQRVLLQVAYHALENSGYVPNSTPCFDPDTFATFVGVATNDYVQSLRNDVDVYYSTGKCRLPLYEAFYSRFTSILLMLFYRNTPGVPVR